VNSILERIQANNVTENRKKAMQTHVRNAKDRQAETYVKIRQGICPLCGGKLVVREGKYGKFYACSNYPRCRFHQSIS
jgi:ssDNA-binding Zn-finger/Zn-ribbon topoisomerase 1